MENNDKTLVHKGFLGLRTSIAEPPPNSARDCQNFVRNQTLGLLTQAPGYSQKFPDGGTNLPQNEDDNNPNFLFRPIYGFTSNIVFENIHNFYLSDHGGKNISVVIGKYTKAAFFPASPTTQRFGVFIRPYWDGTVWVDEWRELNEMFVFELRALSATNRLVIDDGTYGFAANDPSQTVFNSSYFKNWMIVYGGLGDNENYDLVTGCGWTGSNYYLQIPHLNTDYASRVAGTKLIVYRNFLYKDVPTDLESYCYNLFAEMRLTSGNDSEDVSIMAGYRDKSLTFTDVGSATVYTHEIDEIVLDTQVPDYWDKSCVLTVYAEPQVSPLGMDAGTYYFKYALKLDDGSYTKLFDAFTIDQPLLNITSGNSIVLTVPSQIRLFYMRSVGSFPRRAKSIAVFMSDDNVTYYNVNEVDLTNSANLTEAVIPPVWTGVKHFWARGSLYINRAMWLSDIPEASASIGHDIDDDGIIQYRFASVIGTTTFFCGVRDNGILYPNKLFSSAFSGEGSAEFDIAPNDPIHVLNLEYSDGDELMAVGSINELIVAIKKRSVIVVEQDSQLGFQRKLVTKGYGMSSFRTLVSFDDKLYWLDYNGVIRYSINGIDVVNFSWLKDLRSYSDTVLEAAIGAIDRNNRQFRLRIDTKQYFIDFDNFLGGVDEWLILKYDKIPMRYSLDSQGVIDFIDEETNKLLWFVDGDVSLHDGAFVDLYYEENETQRNNDDDDIDMNVKRVICRYLSTVDLTVKLFRENDTTAIATWTLPKEKHRARMRVPSEGKRCSSYRLSVGAHLTDNADNVKIIRLGAKHELIPAGGSEMIEA